MTGGSNPRKLASARAPAEACAAGAIVVGSLVLVGWAFDVTVLKSGLLAFATLALAIAAGAYVGAVEKVGRAADISDQDGGG